MVTDSDGKEGVENKGLRPPEGGSPGQEDPGRPKRSQEGEGDSDQGRSEDLPPVDPARLAEAERMGKVAAEAAAGRRGHDAVLLKVTGRCSYTDFILVVETESDRQVDAVSDRIQDSLRQEGLKPLGVEGRGDGGWVLMDFGDLVVHVFRHDLRSFYDIEGLWHDSPRVDLSDLLAGVEPETDSSEQDDDWEDDEQW